MTALKRKIIGFVIRLTRSGCGFNPKLYRVYIAKKLLVHVAMYSVFTFAVLASDT